MINELIKEILKDIETNDCYFQLYPVHNDLQDYVGIFGIANFLILKNLNR